MRIRCNSRHNDRAQPGQEANRKGCCLWGNFKEKGEAGETYFLLIRGEKGKGPWIGEAMIS